MDVQVDGDSPRSPVVVNSSVYHREADKTEKIQRCQGSNHSLHGGECATVPRYSKIEAPFRFLHAGSELCSYRHLHTLPVDMHSGCQVLQISTSQIQSNKQQQEKKSCTNLHCQHTHERQVSQRID